MKSNTFVNAYSFHKYKDLSNNRWICNKTQYTIYKTIHNTIMVQIHNTERSTNAVSEIVGVNVQRKQKYHKFNVKNYILIHEHLNIQCNRSKKFEMSKIYIYIYIFFIMLIEFCK